MVLIRKLFRVLELNLYGIWQQITTYNLRLAKKILNIVTIEIQINEINMTQSVTLSAFGLFRI